MAIFKINLFSNNSFIIEESSDATTLSSLISLTTTITEILETSRKCLAIPKSFPLNSANAASPLSSCSLVLSLAIERCLASQQMSITEKSHWQALNSIIKDFIPNPQAEANSSSKDSSTSSLFTEEEVDSACKLLSEEELKLLDQSLLSCLEVQEETVAESSEFASITTIVGTGPLIRISPKDIVTKTAEELTSLVVSWPVNTEASSSLPSLSITYLPKKEEMIIEDIFIMPSRRERNLRNLNANLTSCLNSQISLKVKANSFSLQLDLSNNSQMKFSTFKFFQLLFCTKVIYGQFIKPYFNPTDELRIRFEVIKEKLYKKCDQLLYIGNPSCIEDHNYIKTCVEEPCSSTLLQKPSKRSLSSSLSSSKKARLSEVTSSMTLTQPLSSPENESNEDE